MRCIQLFSIYPNRILEINCDIFFIYLMINAMLFVYFGNKSIILVEELRCWERYMAQVLCDGDFFLFKILLL